MVDPPAVGQPIRGGYEDKMRLLIRIKWNVNLIKQELLQGHMGHRPQHTMH